MLTSLMLHDNNLYYIFHETDSIVCEHVEFSKLKQNYTNIICLSNNYYLINTDLTSKVYIDITNQDLVTKLNITNEIKNYESYNKINPVAVELQNEYCLLFAGKVLFHSKDKSEVDAYKVKNRNLLFTEYFPPSVFKK